MKKKLYKKIDENTIKCQACNHYCKIKESKTGLCAIRKNDNAKLDLLVYGLSSGASIDSIEKKPLYHFLPKSKVFSLGTIGCNFGCEFCQNEWISQAIKDPNIQPPGLYELPPKTIVKTCQEKNIDSIAYTYNEPIIFFEYAYDTAKIAKTNNIKNIFITNGYGTEKSTKLIAPYLDAANIDLKAFTERFYRNICKASLKPVLKTIESYYENDIWIEITTLIIPDENDSEKELKNIAKFIKNISPTIPWHVIKFSPSYKMLDKPNTPTSTIKKAYDIGKDVGLKHVYAGNIRDKNLHNTICPQCEELLVKRDWGHTEIKNLKNGKCLGCGISIEGIW